MSRRKKDPLRPLTFAEREALTHLGRSRSAPSAEVIRARLLLAVADGSGYQQAAASVGRRSGDAVSALVARFNQEGLDALRPRHGGGRTTYGGQARDRILREVRREPTREGDGGATWSLSLLQAALRSAADGLPGVSTFTIREVLHEAGYSFQRTRTWCPTGTAQRKRKAGVATVTDPDALAKKS